MFRPSRHCSVRAVSTRTGLRVTGYTTQSGRMSTTCVRTVGRTSLFAGLARRTCERTVAALSPRVPSSGTDSRDHSETPGGQSQFTFSREAGTDRGHVLGDRRRSVVLWVFGSLPLARAAAATVPEITRPESGRLGGCRADGCGVHPRNRFTISSDTAGSTASR